MAETLYGLPAVRHYEALQETQRKIIVLPDVLNNPASYQELLQMLQSHGNVEYVQYPTDGFDSDSICLGLQHQVDDAINNGQKVVFFGTSFGSRIILDYLARYGDCGALEMIWMNGFLPSFHESTIEQKLLRIINIRRESLLTRLLNSDVGNTQLTEGTSARIAHMTTSIDPGKVQHPVCPVIFGFWENDVFDFSAHRSTWIESFPNRCVIQYRGIHGHTNTHAGEIYHYMREAFADLDCG